jgi:hypothetical protein
MRFALDLVVRRGGAVVRIDRGASWRVRSCRAAHSVIELPAGSHRSAVASLTGRATPGARPGRGDPPTTTTAPATRDAARSWANSAAAAVAITTLVSRRAATGAAGDLQRGERDAYAPNIASPHRRSRRGRSVVAAPRRQHGDA